MELNDHEDYLNNHRFYKIFVLFLGVIGLFFVVTPCISDNFSMKKSLQGNLNKKCLFWGCNDLRLSVFTLYLQCLIKFNFHKRYDSFNSNVTMYRTVYKTFI